MEKHHSKDGLKKSGKLSGSHLQKAAITQKIIDIERAGINIKSLTISPKPSSMIGQKNTQANDKTVTINGMIHQAIDRVKVIGF